MLGLVPLLCFVILFATVDRWSRGRGDARDWRSTLLAAAVAWGLLVVAITESLSLFRLLTRDWVLGCWLAAGLLGVVLYRRLPGQGPRFGRLGRGIGRSVSPFLRLLIGVVATILAVVGVVAAMAPPNTNDALDYHMPRVVHWLQNDGVAFYPTAVPRQLTLSPWAEYAIAQFQILSGGDRWANLVQWFSMVGSVVGVTLIAKQLGADRRGQVFAAAVAATIPMGILQGATAQNDYVVSFWLVALVAFGLPLRSAPDAERALWTGGALGLAVLTKATAYLFAGPFLVWFALAGLRRTRWRGVGSLALVAVVALVVNLGHYGRNYELYGSPLGTGQEGPPGTTWGRYANDAFTAGTFASNVVRNLALHAGVPGFTLETAEMIDRAHRVVGLDVNDERTTWTGQSFSVAAPSTDEDFAGNHLHLVLILFVTALCLARRRLRRQAPLVGYLAAVCGGFLLFSLALKWSPWGTRLYLASFVLFAPVAAIALGSITRRVLAPAVVLALLVGALPFVGYAVRRPLIGSDPYRPLETSGNLFAADRLDQYLVTRPHMAADFKAAADFVRSSGCTEVGLYRMDAHEYAAWVLLQQGAQPPPRIEHVNVINSSASLPMAPFAPCAIVALRFYAGDNGTLAVGDRVYERVWSSAEVDVFV